VTIGQELLGETEPQRGDCPGFSINSPTERDS
jgi:hypothetical protein